MRLHVVIALATVCLVLPVHAEQEAGQLTDARARLRDLPEDVQWMAYAVTVLKKQELDEAQRRDIEDIEGAAPGLIVDRMNRTPMGAAIAMRGIGSNQPSKGRDPAVSMTVDGVYVGPHTSRMRTLFDVEEVEIVRGPNLLDPNPNLGGSVNLRRSAPTGELDLAMKAAVGSGGRQEVDAVINAPAATCG